MPSAPDTPSNAVGPALEVHHLSHRFGDRSALADLSFELPRGSVVGLLGRNGAGKTTLLRLLMGQLPRQEGQLTVLGLDPQREPLAVRRQVGHVPENPSFYPWMSVRDLLAFVAHHRPEWDDAWAEALRQRFELEADRKVGALSKGERALLALLLALAFRPPLLLLDEPAQGLDPVARHRFFEGVLSSYGDEGSTVLLSSHLVRDIDTLVDRVVVLERGRLRCARSVDSLRDRVRAFRLHLAPGAESEPGIDLAAERFADIEPLSLLQVDQHGRQARVVIETRPDAFDAVLRRLADGGRVQVEPEALNLEQLFLALNQGAG